MSTHVRPLATGLVVIASVLGLSACTPDTTRGRVEHEIPGAFANAYALSETLQDRPATRPDVTGTECHSSINTKEDSGPGSWGCDLSYTVDGHKDTVSLLVLIDSLGCYQAMDTADRNRMITDRRTDTKIPDPKVGFDGCYDVYDGRTSVSKTAGESG